MLEQYIMNFCCYLCRVGYLIIQFILETQKIYINNNIDYDVHYHHAKSQIKIQLVYGETKKDIALWGKLNQTA
jgi:hypothetical protein